MPITTLTMTGEFWRPDEKLPDNFAKAINSNSIKIDPCPKNIQDIYDELVRLIGEPHPDRKGLLMQNEQQKPV